MDTVMAAHQMAVAQSHVPIPAPQPHERLDIVMTPSTSRGSPSAVMKVSSSIFLKTELESICTCSICLLRTSLSKHDVLFCSLLRLI
uniref:Ovule protein n=1 Tax=Heterorhabditis bacteriophora TaxID=37862 RepID=A0A1I7XAD8_HETBA